MVPNADMCRTTCSGKLGIDSCQKMRLTPYSKRMYLRTFPMVMLRMERGRLARMRPSMMVMALPKIGMKAKNPIHAPCPAMNRSALSRLSCDTCRQRSIHSIFPILPTPQLNNAPATLPMEPQTIKPIGSRPAANSPNMTASLLKGKKLPARNAETNIPQ